MQNAKKIDLFFGQNHSCVTISVAPSSLPEEILELEFRR